MALFAEMAAQDEAVIRVAWEMVFYSPGRSISDYVQRNGLN